MCMYIYSMYDVYMYVIVVSVLLVVIANVIAIAVIVIIIVWPLITKYLRNTHVKQKKMVNSSLHLLRLSVSFFLFGYCWV